MSPHRSTELVLRCRECKEPAEATCLRCGTPACNAHAPPTDDQRCIRCEETYALKTQTLQSAADGTIHASFGRPFVAIVGTWLASGAFTLAAVNSSLIWVSTALFVVLMGLVGLWYVKTPPRERSARRKLRRSRRKFLAKRAPRQLPAAID